MDSFVVSARKYRPITFDSVVGQKAITSTLQNAIRTNTLAQAFLFCGPRGVGKTTCARIMAKTINCMNPTADMEACDECESCRSFNNSNSFNIYELDAASNNSVDDIRNLVDQVRIPPQVGQYKVYIIDEVHMLSSAAFNAFLKTLEEPPAYAKFILATTEKHKIIPTILSRCQIFDFKRITVDDISKHLQNIAVKEGVVAEEEALNIVAQKADGALRDALSIFDQMVSFSGKNITYKDVINNLNVLDYEYYFRMVDYILNKDNNSILLLLNNVVENGFDIQHFIQGLASHLRNLLLGRDEKLVELMEVSRQLKVRYVEQSQRCSQYFLLKTLDLANQCDLNFRNSNNKRLHLEICLMKMCYVEGQQSAVSGQQSVVGNCHKMPAECFTRRRLTAEEIIAAWQPIIERYADKHWIFTVSPIRHVKDGLHENQLSKATLLQAVDVISNQYAAVSYFPSYEIMLDELRDYRFYADDLVHPSSLAVQYIWERFIDCFCTPQTRNEMNIQHKRWKQTQHRPLH